MITSETPAKLAEIIRDTWPQLYRPSAKANKSIAPLNNGHASMTKPADNESQD